MDARLDTHLDTLSDELYQMNTHVSPISRWQAYLGGFVESLSPSPEASEDDDDDSNNDDEDGDASSPSDDKMST